MCQILQLWFINPYPTQIQKKNKGDTYLDAQTVCVPLVPNLSVVVLVVRPFLPNVIVGRVHVVTSLSIDDLVFVRFVNSRYMPMFVCEKKGYGLRLIWIRGFSGEKLTFIMAFDEIRKSVARSLTILFLLARSSPVSSSDKARCKATPCLVIRS